jgi:hypothetical protein
MKTMSRPAVAKLRPRLMAATIALGTAATLGAVAAPSANAATPNQLCRTNTVTPLYTSPTTIVLYIPAGALVRIVDYADAYHYLARYSNVTGQIARSQISQPTCYNQ